MADRATFYLDGWDRTSRHRTWRSWFWENAGGFWTPTSGPRNRHYPTALIGLLFVPLGLNALLNLEAGQGPALYLFMTAYGSLMMWRAAVALYRYEGRPFVRLERNGLTVRPTERDEPQRLPWNEVARVDTEETSIILSRKHAKPVRLDFPTYYRKNVPVLKERVAGAARRRGVPVSMH